MGYQIERDPQTGAVVRMWWDGRGHRREPPPARRTPEVRRLFKQVARMLHERDQFPLPFKR